MPAFLSALARNKIFALARRRAHESQCERRRCSLRTVGRGFQDWRGLSRLLDADVSSAALARTVWSERKSAPRTRRAARTACRRDAHLCAEPIPCLAHETRHKSF